MTAATEAKKAGYESLKEVSDLLGTKPDGKPVVRRETLHHWFNNKPLLFSAVLYSAKHNKKT